MNSSRSDAAANASSYARDLIVPTVPITPTRRLRVCRTAARTAGWMTSTTGMPYALGEALTGIPQHGRRRGVARDHEQLDALGDEVVHHRERVAAHLGDRLRAVRRVRGVADVEDGLLRQLVDDRAGHGESADAAVEDSDRRVGHPKA